MHSTSSSFIANARTALADDTLQRALRRLQGGFPVQRQRAMARLPEFEALREAGRSIKDHTLEHLDFYLELYEENVAASGGQVHWARTSEEACAAVLRICRAAGAATVTKGKSMIAEEIGLNAELERHGIAVVETDLGEYIIQLRHERPSHLIAPAIHLLRGQVAETFRREHQTLDPSRPLAEPRQLCDEARIVLRDRFHAAEVGITGANFLVAETGSSIIVTNEGNGDLTQTLPRVHVVLASIEKLVPSFADAATLLRLLARSATGQEFSSYTTVSTGPRRPGDRDGPEEYHVVLIDNGRSTLLGGDFREMLRCIRCAACINHCPVYAAVGGHAYGWVYPGPMGAVLTPSLIGIDEAGPLPNASTLCGRCDSVCPVKIPLPKLLRHWREREFAQRLVRPSWRFGLRVWAYLARRPALYHLGAAVVGRVLGWAGRRRGRFRTLPFAAGWTAVRDMPEPLGREAAPMSAAREQILATVRRALGRGRLDGEAETLLRERLAAHRRNLVPARAAALDGPARVDLFVAMAEEAQATVARVGAASEVPKAVADYLARENLPAECAMAPDPGLDAIPWEAWPLLRVRRGGWTGEATSLTPAFAAIAETGTLMLVSGPATPTGLNFLPETHIVILDAEQILAAYEDGWDRLRAGRGSPQDLPRVVNFITGPSRTADIEQEIVQGMHGPRRLHIVLIDHRPMARDDEPPA